MKCSKEIFTLPLLVFVAVLLSGCSGINYSWKGAGADEYRPSSIAVLPVDVGPNTEAASVADAVVATCLKKTGWFSSVVSSEDIRSRFESDSSLQQTVNDYLVKLRKLSYSDPDMSGSIGLSLDIQSFLVVTVDSWEYTTKRSEKVGKVGFTVNLVDAPTGEIMWKASHCEMEDYLLIKPDLDDIATAVVKKILARMPGYGK